MPAERAFNIPSCIVWISAVLIAVHVIRQFMSPETEMWFLLTFSFIPARYGDLAAFLPGGVAARYWTPLTYAFLHGDALHLTVNLVWLASFGSALARRFGTGRFLALSAVAAVAGAGAHYIAYPADEGIVIGASGAISGVTAAIARFAFNPGGPLGGSHYRDDYRVPALSLAETFANGRAMAFILVWFGMNLVFGLSGAMVPGVEGTIAWQAHIGGFVAGLLFFSAFDPVRSRPSGDDRLET
jgi:membrane associated rhomboid family serine protease